MKKFSNFFSICRDDIQDIKSAKELGFFVRLCEKARYKDNGALLKGQILTSRKEIKESFSDVSSQEVKTFLKRSTRKGRIIRQSNRGGPQKGTLIGICRYLENQVNQESDLELTKTPTKPTPIQTIEESTKQITNNQPRINQAEEINLSELTKPFPTEESNQLTKLSTSPNNNEEIINKKINNIFFPVNELIEKFAYIEDYGTKPEDYKYLNLSDSQKQIAIKIIRRGGGKQKLGQLMEANFKPEIWRIFNEIKGVKN